MIGYGDQQKGYRLLDKLTREAIISRDATFEENSFGGRSKDEVLADPEEPEESEDSDYEPGPSIEQNCSESEIEHLSENTLECPNKRKRQSPVQFGDVVSHNWINAVQSQDGKWSGSVPNHYHDAIKSPNAEFWKRVIQEELDSHKKHATFHDVEALPDDVQPVSSRWIFREKVIPNSSIKTNNSCI